MVTRTAKRVQAMSSSLREMSATYEKFRESVPPASAPELTDALALLSAQNDELRAVAEELRAQLAVLERNTDRIAAERERYKDLFERATDAYFVTDRFGNVLDVNGRGALLLGREARFLRGRPLAVLVTQGTVSELRRAISAAGDPKIGPVNVCLRKADGTDGVTLALDCRLVDRGARILFVGRERAPAEPHAESISRALRDHVELLARERDVRQRLQRSDRAKDHFMAVLAHDLRGPINAILGWADLLTKEFLVKEARDRAVEVIRRNARFQQALVEELLDVTRISSDKLQLELVPLDLTTVVRRSVESMMPAAAQAGVTLDLQIASGALTIDADAMRFEQVLRNILVNAIKFSHPKGVVRVSIEQEGTEICLRVADGGRGIAADVLPNVFDLLRQDSRDSISRNGLGLGLYIVRQLVRLMGGSVEAASEGSEKGAVFTLRFRARDCIAPVSSSESVGQVLRDELAGVNVLIVEDDEDTSDLVRTFLVDSGASVASAVDVPSALRLFETMRPDVLVSDIALEGDDGCTLVRALRAKDKRFIAIAVSGFTGAADIARAREAGFGVHINKPFSGAKLVEEIRLQLTARRT